jgi:hypothetical protein
MIHAKLVSELTLERFLSTDSIPSPSFVCRGILRVKSSTRAENRHLRANKIKRREYLERAVFFPYLRVSRVSCELSGTDERQSRLGSSTATRTKEGGIAEF